MSLATPERIRTLQQALYVKAKQEPLDAARFWRRRSCTPPLGVVGKGTQQARRQRRVDPFEEFEKDERDRVARWLQAVASGVRHVLLTTTSLRRLPLWALGSDDVQQVIADTGNDGTGMVEYVVGLRALVARNYSIAATYLAQAEQRGLRLATIRPLLVYALCLAGNLDAARQLGQGVISRDGDERHYWNWLGAKFGVGPGARK